MSRLRLLLGALAPMAVVAAVSCGDEGSALDSPPPFDATLSPTPEASADAPLDTNAEGGDGAADATDATLDGDTGTAGDGSDGAIVYPPFSCGGGDAGVDADADAAVDAGVVDGCAVSWTVDLFSAMKASGTYQCGSGLCHGAGIPGRPSIDSTDAATTYQNFASFMVVDSGDRPIILPGSTDPNASVIDCVLRRECVYPMPPGNAVSIEYLGKIDQWICCGAPFN